MSIKSIILHLTRDPRNEVRAANAIDIATSFEAHLTALYTIPPMQLPTSYMGYVPAEYIEKIVEEERQQAEMAKEVFEEQARRAAISAEWRTVEGYPPEAVAFQARYADLAIVGQPGEEEETPASSVYMPDELLLTAGRPIMFIPYAGKFPQIGKRILIGWDGSREASRAVHDALPFLTRADAVLILGVNVSSASHIPGADISSHLARHGVNVEAHHSVAPDLSVGDALLDAVSDYGCDMLVMGAYGHSRVRELVLGGATRHVLKHMTVPVLMSH